MEEERRTEVVHEVTFAPEETPEEKVDNSLEGVDLDDNRAVADYFMAKNNLIDPDQLEIEKKEKELREDIKSVVENPEELIDYLTNLHASIEVMEERIYELELQMARKEKQSLTQQRPNNMPRGLSSLPMGIF